jgi:hypothetical protein
MAGTIVIAAALTTGGVARASDRFVSRTGDDTGNACTSALAPCRTPAHAFAQSAPFDVIKVAKATYQGSVPVDVSTTIAIEGGWSPDFSVRDPARYRTTVGGIIEIRAGAGETIDLTLDGLTLSEPSPGVAAVRVNTLGDGEVHIMVAHCVLERNEYAIQADAYGTSTLELDVVDSRLVKNLVGMRIRGFDTGTLTARVTRSEMRSNSGGMSALRYDSSVVDLQVLDSLVRSNRSTGLVAGGPVNVTLTNTAISKNKSGGIRIDGSTVLTAVNTTITGNRTRAEAGGSGILIFLAASATLTNTIVWGNRATVTGLDDIQMLANAGTVSAAFSDIGARHTLGGTFVDGGGNISADPIVRGTVPRPRPGSPVIDTGTCAGAPVTDIDGDPRPTGPGCDMGADEVVP